MTVRTLGVEEEFLLVDSVTGGLLPAGPEALAADPELQREMDQEQVETGTSVLLRMSDVREELLHLRRRAAKAADHAGAALAALGVSPLVGRPTTSDDERYRWMVEQYGIVGREQLTCGCHVHVGVASRDEAVGAVDRMRPWLACLTALSANSPYWQGEDTGYASWRTQLWSRWPSAGQTEVFGSAAEYDRVGDAMVASGALLDRRMLYYTARPSEHLPTVETRVADVCLTADDAVLVAALVRALVHTAAAEWAADVPPAPARTELLRLAAWQASRTGVRDRLLDPATGEAAGAPAILDRLVAHVRDALEEAGDLDVVRDGLARVLRDGTGADAQRRSYARTGDLADVVRDAIPRTVAG